MKNKYSFIITIIIIVIYTLVGIHYMHTTSTKTKLDKIVDNIIELEVYYKNSDINDVDSLFKIRNIVNEYRYDISRYHMEIILNDSSDYDIDMIDMAFIKLNYIESNVNKKIRKHKFDENNQ